jgi:hypothetical protein
MNGNQSSGTVTEVVQQIEEKKQQHCYMHYSSAMRAIKSSADVLCIGLAFFNVDVKQSRRHRSSLMREFRKHFGASCAVLAEQWNTLLYTNIEDAKLSDKEASVTGFRNFLMAHHFLWAYPSNAVILGRRFKVCESYASGQLLFPRRLRACLSHVCTGLGDHPAHSPGCCVFPLGTSSGRLDYAIHERGTFRVVL